jgi:hypothetical protein
MKNEKWVFVTFWQGFSWGTLERFFCYVHILSGFVHFSGGFVQFSVRFVHI